MTGLEVCIGLMVTGRIFNVGLGSVMSDIDRAIPLTYVEEIDEIGRGARRDYGLIEVSLVKDNNDWILTAFTLELHRLSGSADLQGEVRSDAGVSFQRYMPWAQLEEKFSTVAHDASLQAVRQGDFLEYRNEDAKVSAFVVNDNTERGEWPGHGDVWSISVG